MFVSALAPAELQGISQHGLSTTESRRLAVPHPPPAPRGEDGDKTGKLQILSQILSTHAPPPFHSALIRERTWQKVIQFFHH